MPAAPSARWESRALREALESGIVPLPVTGGRAAARRRRQPSHYLK
jgi:hypothetical protein